MVKTKAKNDSEMSKIRLLALPQPLRNFHGNAPDTVIIQCAGSPRRKGINRKKKIATTTPLSVVANGGEGEAGKNRVYELSCILGFIQFIHQTLSVDYAVFRPKNRCMKPLHLTVWRCMNPV
jgi:hypothetical protein